MYCRILFATRKDSCGSGGGATGSETVSVTGLASTTFGGKEFNAGLRDVKYNKSEITQSGTNGAYGEIMIPASNIYSLPGMKHFPGVNVQGNWINVKSDGSGATPLSRMGLYPLKYNHSYPPFSPKTK
ncbi:hypothetical protein [Flavobacterium sp. NKUCC04_CG]|uniref:hypothetical protein n=1 Tax=Flavobacterium sp. NKUCC04_CG TaxID=2842121 RepID=UPI001C5B62D4|nr:hypothetical protein [Flavobacterium sp. NKUCC04_CG]MBW3518331.1 hypothetical protein [Flavobacterium sp. NKUCC04_CG]